jgi:GntR family transcriptional regulator/MocR family aminotransferase
MDEPALLAAAARRGVAVEGLSLHSYTGASPPGLVIGHAHLSEPAIERGVELLAQAAGEVRRDRDLV